MQGLADATVRARSNGTVIARTQHVYELASGSPAGVNAIVERETREEKFELDGAPISTTRTRREFDAFANVTLETVDWSDAAVRTTRTVFENDTSRWLIGMVRRLELTASAPGIEAQTRTRESQYDRSGRLARAILEPDHPELRLERVYTFDLFGNVSAIETSGFGIAPRSELTFFDPRGQASDPGAEPPGAEPAKRVGSALRGRRARVRPEPGNPADASRLRRARAAGLDHSARRGHDRHVAGSLRCSVSRGRGHVRPHRHSGPRGR